MTLTFWCQQIWRKGAKNREFPQKNVILFFIKSYCVIRVVFTALIVPFGMTKVRTCTRTPKASARFAAAYTNNPQFESSPNEKSLLRQPQSKSRSDIMRAVQVCQFRWIRFKYTGCSNMCFKCFKKEDGIIQMVVAVLCCANTNSVFLVFDSETLVGKKLYEKLLQVCQMLKKKLKKLCVIFLLVCQIPKKGSVEDRKMTCTQGQLDYDWIYSLKILAHFWSKVLEDFHHYVTQINCLTGATISETYIRHILRMNIFNDYMILHKSKYKSEI